MNFRAHSFLHTFIAIEPYPVQSLVPIVWRLSYATGLLLPSAEVYIMSGCSTDARGEQQRECRPFPFFCPRSSRSNSSSASAQANGVERTGVDSKADQEEARGQKRPAPPEASEAAQQKVQMDGQHARPAKKACNVRPPERSALAMLIGS